MFMRWRQSNLPFSFRNGNVSNCFLLNCRQVVYAEEQTGFKDKIRFEFTGSNLDKKDLFSESDPFFTISRLNPDGTHTIVYRSEYVKVTPTKTLRVVLLRKENSEYSECCWLCDDTWAFYSMIMVNKNHLINQNKLLTDTSDNTIFIC